jgi:GR25 family glycosyltransferase involved in LPS biosynthesis
MNEYFDKIYILSLRKEKARRKLLKSRLDAVNIKYEFFDAVDGELFKHLNERVNNDRFTTPNYLACQISHLSIYNDALSNNYKKILILEDDVIPMKDINSFFDNIKDQIPEYYDLLYLGYIPLTDDCGMWSYNVFADKFISDNVFHFKNLWGLYAYSISDNMMREMVDTYKESFPMEIDRYFVTNQKQFYGISPQLFCHDISISGNENLIDYSSWKKSIDPKLTTKDYLLCPTENTITYIVPTIFESKKFIEHIIKIANTDSIAEVIILNNTNEELEFVEVTNSPVRVIRTNELTINEAWNLGIESSKTEYVILAKDNVIFTTTVIDIIAADLSNNVELAGFETDIFIENDFRELLSVTEYANIINVTPERIVKKCKIVGVEIYLDSSFYTDLMDLLSHLFISEYNNVTMEKTNNITEKYGNIMFLKKSAFIKIPNDIKYNDWLFNNRIEKFLIKSKSLRIKTSLH